MADILDAGRVAEIKSITETDLAADQYDPPDLKLIVARETLDALCNSHEALRAELDELKKERYIRSLYGPKQDLAQPMPGVYGPDTLAPIRQLQKDVAFLADIIRNQVVNPGTDWDKLKHISDPTYPG